VLGVVDANRDLKQPDIFAECEALVVLRIRDLGHYFLKPGEPALMYSTLQV